MTNHAATVLLTPLVFYKILIVMIRIFAGRNSVPEVGLSLFPNLRSITLFKICVFEAPFLLLITARILF